MSSKRDHREHHKPPSAAWSYIEAIAILAAVLAAFVMAATGDFSALGK